MPEQDPSSSDRSCDGLFFTEAAGGNAARASTRLSLAGPDPSRAIFPSADLYDRITCPLTIVLADGGFYAQRRAEVQAIVDTVPDRRLVDIASNHNVTMTRPAELAAVILELVAGQTSPIGDGH